MEKQLLLVLLVSALLLVSEINASSCARIGKHCDSDKCAHHCQELHKEKVARKERVYGNCETAHCCECRGSKGVHLPVE